MAESAQATAPATVPQDGAEQGAQGNTHTNGQAKPSEVTDAIVNEAVGAESPQKAPTKQPEKKPESPREKFKYKNREIELTAEEMRQHAQRSIGGELRFQEAAELDKRNEATRAKLEALKDPKQSRKILQELMGDNFRTIAEETLYEEMQREREQENFSPTEREIYKHLQRLQSENETYKSAQQEQEQARLEARNGAIYDGIKSQIEDTAMMAMESMDIPGEIRIPVANRVSRIIESALDNDIPLDPAQVSALAKREMMAEQEHLRDGMDETTLSRWTKPDVERIVKAFNGQQIVEWLGKEVVTKIRQYDLERYQSRQSQPSNGFQRNPPSQVQAREPEDNKRGRWAELEKMGIKRP